MTDLTILPVTGIADVRPGDDLADLITTAAPWLVSGDVLVVTSKIVSKAEGALVAVPREEGPDREAAKAAVLAAETARVVASRGVTRIVATHHGFVMAAAGIDASNVDSSQLVLLPKDPDASARALRADLRSRFGLDVVVIVSDTMGRPWRIGLTDVALGVAGIDPVRDYRGERDAYGNELHMTQMSSVDELAGAAELVKGKYDQVPVAVVRGFGVTGTPDGPGASILVRAADEDMFSLGTAEARALGTTDGLRHAAALPIGPDADQPAGEHRPQPRDFHPREPEPEPAEPQPPDSQPSQPQPLDVALRRATDQVRDYVEWTRLDAVTEAPAVAGAPAVAETPVPAETRVAGEPDPPDVIAVLVPRPHPGADALAIARAGAAVHATRCALAADGLATTWLPGTPDQPLGQVTVTRATQT